MTARERHVDRIKDTELEVKRANPNGVHIKDLRKKLARLKRELYEYDRLFGKDK